MIFREQLRIFYQMIAGALFFGELEDRESRVQLIKMLRAELDDLERLIDPEPEAGDGTDE